VASEIVVVRVFVREPVPGLPDGSVITIEQPEDGDVSYTDAGVLVSFRDATANRQAGRPATQVRSNVLIPFWNVLAVRREFV
jgi:hypothetical protein